MNVMMKNNTTAATNNNTNSNNIIPAFEEDDDDDILNSPGGSSKIVSNYNSPKRNSLGLGNLNLEDIKRAMTESVKDSEIVMNLFNKTTSNADEINKLYESLLDVRRILTEQQSINKVVDLKELPFRLIDI